MMAISERIEKCRLCGGKNLIPVLDLGAQPPANSLRKVLEKSPVSIPLIICRCSDCTTVQLSETVLPEVMFRDYFWVTGTSQTAINYAKQFYENVIQRCPDQKLFVTEIASNDGTFLRQFKQQGHRILGIDPAQNIADVAERSGVPTISEFFGLQLAKRVKRESGLADVVIARNVIPHVPDPNDVVSGISYLLSDNGTGAIEFHWVAKILAELHYDSIYHEHFFYHTLRSIAGLLSRHNLNIFDVTESPISGGSLVVYFSRAPREPTLALSEKLAIEEERQLFSLDTWQEFARSSIEHRIKLKEIIKNEVNSGRRMIGYGASARSSTLLNFCGVDRNHLICIADQNPLKHNHFTPGTDILITSPEVAFSHQPNTVLLLAWNFKEEILNRLKSMGFRGNVILPLPNSPALLKL